MERNILPKGDTAWIGVPASPMSESLIALLRAIAEQSRDASFAYVPQIYCRGFIDPPRQVIYLVLRESARGRVDDVMISLMPAIHARWPDSEAIDVLPVFADHAWLPDVIRTGCVLAINDQAEHQRCVAKTNRDTGTEFPQCAGEITI